MPKRLVTASRRRAAAPRSRPVHRTGFAWIVPTETPDFKGGKRFTIIGAGAGRRSVTTWDRRVLWRPDARLPIALEDIAARDQPVPVRVVPVHAVPVGAAPAEARAGNRRPGRARHRRVPDRPR